MTHTDKAIAVSRETGWNLDDWAESHDWAGVGLGPVGQHRDSGALDRSNFRVILQDLQSKFPNDVADCNFGHWGVGWVEEITWNAGNPDVVAQVESWELALSDYPVASDEDYSGLEWEEFEEWCDTLNLEGEYNGFEYVWNPFIKPTEIKAEIARMLSESHSVSRPDDAPGEDEIAQGCIAASILIVDDSMIARYLEEAERQRDLLIDKIEDVSRGIADLDDLRECVRYVNDRIESYVA
jgi:hypothetical protein